MCGIIGYIGKNKALPILIDGLKKLEYRGYDSSGIALQTQRQRQNNSHTCTTPSCHLYLKNLSKYTHTFQNFLKKSNTKSRTGENLCTKCKSYFIATTDNTITSIKSKGKIKELEQKIFDNISKSESDQQNQLQATVGIAHTRWATHGKPDEKNAHPHSDCKQKIFVVHNGIIENYQELKEHLSAKGHTFTSQTDTEVIAHLIEDFYENNLKIALEKTLKLLKGAYGLAVIHANEPNKILVARHGSPLIIGVGENETIIASDIAGIVSHTKKVIYLDDKEIAEITDKKAKIFNLENKELKKDIKKIEWDIEKVQKQGFPDFMLKEIHEQPEAIIDTIRG